MHENELMEIVEPIVARRATSHPITKKEVPMSFTKLLAVAAVLSMFAVAADARPARHHHHRHHHRHHVRR